MNNKLKTLILIPILAPILFVYVISIINYKITTKIRLLTWTSPAISIAIPISTAATLGVLFASTFTLQGAPNRKLSRKVIIDPLNPQDYINDYVREEINNDNYNTENSYEPERNLHDPTPTITVPYRIIKKASPIKQSQVHNYEEPANYDQEQNNQYYQNEYNDLPSEEDWETDINDSWK